MNLYYNLNCAKNILLWSISIWGELEIRLEFEHISLNECNNFSKGSHKPNTDSQVFNVGGGEKYPTGF